MPPGWEKPSGKVKQSSGSSSTSAHACVSFSPPSDQDGRVQCTHLLTPHVTLLDGQILDFALHSVVNPVLLALVGRYNDPRERRAEHRSLAFHLPPESSIILRLKNAER